MQFQVVPYKGAAQSQLDVVAGNIDFATPTVTSASPQLQGGTVRGAFSKPAAGGYRVFPTCRPSRISVTSSKRRTGSVWPVRPGCPKEILQKVNSVITASMAKPENQSRIHQQGMIISPMDSGTYQAFVAHEALRWRPVILKAGLKDRVGGGYFFLMRNVSSRLSLRVPSSRSPV